MIIASPEKTEHLGSSVSPFYPSSPPELLPPLYRCTCKPEPFHLPTLDGLHVIPGLCDRVFLAWYGSSRIPQNTSTHPAAVIPWRERPIVRKDPRFLERDALLNQRSEGSKMIFPGVTCVYGVTAAVCVTTKTTLSVVLAVRLLIILYHSALLNSPSYGSSRSRRLRMTSSKPSYRID